MTLDTYRWIGTDYIDIKNIKTNSEANFIKKNYKFPSNFV